MHSLNDAGRSGCCRHAKSTAIALVTGLALYAASCAAAAEKDELKVCADPNNLPFSNEDGAGFENKLAGGPGTSHPNPSHGNGAKLETGNALAQ